MFGPDGHHAREVRRRIRVDLGEVADEVLEPGRTTGDDHFPRLGGDIAKRVRLAAGGGDDVPRSRAKRPAVQPEFELSLDNIKEFILVLMHVRRRPGLVAASLFSFIQSFENLELTLLLVGPGRTTPPVAMLNYLEFRIDPTIAAVATVQIVLIGALMLITDRFVKLSRIV